MTLPARTQPMAGQSLDSYLETVADINGLSTAELAALIQSQTNRPLRYIALQPDATTVSAIATMTGISIAQVQRMTLDGLPHREPFGLCGFDSAERSAFSRISNRGWLRTRNSQLCPACLAEVGVWQTSWRLQTSTCCVRHRNYLATQCPSCRRPFRDQRSSPLRPVGAALTCGNPAGPGLAARCACDLTTIRTGRPTEPEIKRQRHLDQALLGAPVSVMGEQVSAATYLVDSRNLAILLLHLAQQSAPPESHNLGWTAVVRAQKTEVWGKHPPESAEVRSGVLTDAHQILTAVSRTEAAKRFASWLERVPRTNDGVLSWAADHTKLTPTLLALLNSALNPRRRLSYRLDHRRQFVTESRHIPQQIPLDLYQKHIADVLQVRNDIGRTFTSMCLARSLPDATTWSDALRLLGLPEKRFRRIPNLASAGLLVSVDELLSRLQALATALPVVDHRQLEAKVRRLAETDDWFTAWCREARPGTRASSRLYAITWFWEHRAGGHPLTSPVQARQGLTSYRQFSQALTPAMQRALLAILGTC